MLAHGRNNYIKLGKTVGKLLRLLALVCTHVNVVPKVQHCRITNKNTRHSKNIYAAYSLQMHIKFKKRNMSLHAKISKFHASQKFLF